MQLHMLLMRRCMARNRWYSGGTVPYNLVFAVSPHGQTSQKTRLYGKITQLISPSWHWDCGTYSSSDILLFEAFSTIQTEALQPT